MDNEKMEEIMNNGVSDYWVALKDWAKEFWTRNYPYEFSKEQFKDMMDDVIDEKRALRNKALKVMANEIQKIIEEKQKDVIYYLEIESFDQPALTLSEQEQEIAKMKERVISRLYKENVAPNNYKELLKASQRENQMLEK